MCLIAGGRDLGEQNDYLKKEKILDNKILKKLKKKLRNVETPVDFAVNIKNKRVEVPLHKFPNHFEIFDIGEKTIVKYVTEISKAKSIYMKGPAGFCADKKFCKGTEVILRAIAKNRGFSLIGGGHLSDAIKRSKISKRRFSHISLSGGALLRYIAGEKLPGLEVLK